MATITHQVLSFKDLVAKRKEFRRSFKPPENT